MDALLIVVLVISGAIGAIVHGAIGFFLGLLFGPIASLSQCYLPIWLSKRLNREYRGGYLRDRIVKGQKVHPYKQDGNFSRKPILRLQVHLKKYLGFHLF